MCIKLGTTKHQACAGPIDQQYAGEEKKKLWKKYKKKKKKTPIVLQLAGFRGTPLQSLTRKKNKSHIEKQRDEESLTLFFFFI